MGPDTRSIEDHSDGDAVAPRAAVDLSSSQLMGTAEPVIGPGVNVARYQVRERLGAGGMGEVFAAYDPTLDRIVALKILKSELAGASPQARARFQREAQAMARLNHPNVVVVFDVITVADRVFVAMERVTGPTLAAWLADRPRTWREVVAIMLQAGRGLEAAHAAGIVHRDFKPSNVILGDRVRVADFGLARAPHEADPVSAAAETPLEVTLTRTGTAMGTAAYMAPEQRDGQAVNAASDQYAFAVTLHEALFGARPGQPQPTPPRAVPRWLRAVVERGLRERVEDRYPSMRHMLADLARDPARTRRWLLAAALPATVAIVALRLGTGTAIDCSLAGADVEQSWRPQERSRIATSFAAARSYGGAMADRVAASLDAYVARWRTVKVDACRATHERGEQSAQLLDRRARCLDQGLGALQALLSALGKADGATVDRALDATAALPPPEGCSAARGATVPPLPDQPKVRAVERALAGVAAAFPLARMEEAQRFNQEALRGSAELGIPSLRAQSLLWHGSLQALTDVPQARVTAETAILEANRAGDRELAARATTLLLEIAAIEGEPRRLDVLMPLARAAVAGIDASSPELARLAKFESVALGSLGRFDEALALCPRAADGAAACRCHVLAKARRSREAKPVCELHLQQQELRLFADNPLLIPPLHNLAAVLNTLGEYQRGLVLRERSLAMARASYGKDNLWLAMELQSRGTSLLNLERHREAAADFEEALAILDRIGHPAGTSAADLRFMLAKTRTAQGQFAQAVTMVREGLALAERLLGPDHPDMAGHLFQYGITLQTVAAHRKEALAAFQRSAILAKDAGSNNPLLYPSLAMQADVLIALGRASQAIAPARQALQLATALGLDPYPREQTRAILGTALLVSGDRAQGRRELEQARDFFRAQGPVAATDLEEAETLLRKYRR